MIVSLFASFMAMQMLQVARGWLTWDMTGSAGAVGLVSAAWGLPMLFLALTGGLLADAVSKRLVIMVTQLALAALGFATALLVLGDVIQVWHLIVIGVAQGAIFALNLPSRHAIIPELVGEQHLGNAIALNASVTNLTRVLGPAMAGALTGIAAFGMGGVLLLIAALNLVAMVLVAGIAGRNDAAAPRGRSGRSELLAGLHYVWSTPRVRELIAVGFVVSFFGMSYLMLLPAIVGEVFNGGALSFGLMQAAAGVGAILGSLALAVYSHGTERIGLQRGLALGFGVALLLFGVTSAVLEEYWIGLLLIPAVGCASQVFQSVNNTMLISRSTPKMRGRVMSVYLMTWSLMPLAVLPAGVIADRIGVATLLSLSATIIIVFILVSHALGREDGAPES